MTHSPLPWHDDGYRVYAACDDEDKRRGQVIFDYKQIDDANFGDYAFIMQAVHAYYPLQEENAKLREALEEIALGQGSFEYDPLKHAHNAIHEMMETARLALGKD